MRTPIPSRWQLRLVNLSFVALFLVAVGLLQWLAGEYRLQFDWTAARRHSLSAASQAALAGLKEPLTVTAYASQRGAQRRAIAEFVARYQKYRPDLRLEFVDPDAEPARTRAAGVQYDGELVVSYGAARENLPPNRLTEEQLTNTLTRLAHRGERWLVFLSGHGEGSPDGNRNFDYSTWAAELGKRGFKTRALALGDHPQIPANATALVLAGPQTRLLPGEVREIERYLGAGGSLLWLSNPGAGQGLEPLAEALGIELLPGVIVDPASAALTGNATAVVVAKYGAHPIVRRFADVTLFPQAGAIALANAAGENAARRGRVNDGWQGQVLIDTRAESWAETGPLDGAVRFDKGRDLKGPLNLGVALTRAGGDDQRREQRAVVIGDADFLTNAYLGNAGNLELGMSIVNWLSQDEGFVSIPVHTARDRSLSLSPAAQAAIALGFLVVLPLAMIAAGVTIWLRRRKR